MMMMKIMAISLEKILGVALFGRRRPDQCGLQLLHWPMLVPALTPCSSVTLWR